MLVRALKILIKDNGEDNAETKASRGGLAELYRRCGKANEGARILYGADADGLSGLGHAE